MRFTSGEIAAALDAMWDNAIDARLADAAGVTFDEIAHRNAQIFRAWLRWKTCRDEAMRLALGFTCVPLHPSA